jgi:hypothetical protein
MSGGSSLADWRASQSKNESENLRGFAGIASSGISDRVPQSAPDICLVARPPVSMKAAMRGLRDERTGANLRRQSQQSARELEIDEALGVGDRRLLALRDSDEDAHE